MDAHGKVRFALMCAVYMLTLTSYDRILITSAATLCRDPPAPDGGSAACDDWALGRICSPSCGNNSDFAQPLVQSLYVCGRATGAWAPSNRFPDCTRVSRPNDVRMAMDLHYYYGDCSTPEAQAQIQQNVIQILNESVFNATCQDPAFKDKCKAENVKAKCSVVTSRKRRAEDNVDHHSRTRRSILRTTVTLDIIVYLDGFEPNDTEESQVMIGEEGVQIAKNISRQIITEVDNGSFTLNINGSALLFITGKNFLNISEPKLFCAKGQTFRDGYCLNCTEGTFFNQTSGNCEDCPIGTYQENTAQEKCLKCPPSTSTNETRTKNSSDCLVMLSPSAIPSLPLPHDATTSVVVVSSASQTANQPQSISPSSIYTTLTPMSQSSIIPTTESTVKPTPTSVGKMDECTNYTVLSGENRAQGNTLQNDLKCDNNLTTGWYRFQGAAGDRMLDKCVLMYRCGTWAPGWLDGTHPTVAEGVATRKVCYHDWNGCCDWSNNIKVKNCGSFYVYELQKPPDCDLRYCGNAGAVDGCKIYTVLSEADRAQGSTARNDSSDENLLTGWYRFQGAAGDRMADKCVQHMYRCGTRVPGWLSGSNPTVAEGVVTRKVCYHWYGSCCEWSNDIRVKNCGDFYVYELQRTLLSSARYCGNAGGGILCEPPRPFPNLKILPPCNRSPGDSCKFACERGYNLIGSDIRRCNSNGAWTGTQPRCDAVTCKALSTPTNGELLGCNTTDMLYDTVCRFFCKKGSEASGSTVRRCRENGTWTGNDLICTGVAVQIHVLIVLLRYFQ